MLYKLSSTILYKLVQHHTAQICGQGNGTILQIFRVRGQKKIKNKLMPSVRGLTLALLNPNASKSTCTARVFNPRSRPPVLNSNQTPLVNWIQNFPYKNSVLGQPFFDAFEKVFLLSSTGTFVPFYQWSSGAILPVVIWIGLTRGRVKPNQ